MRYNFRAEGYSITDEEVVRSNNTADRIGHDLIKQSGFEVWTGEGKTGTQLVEGTDFALSVKDVKRSTEAAFDIYTLFAVTNASYEGVTLYLSYTACGDYLSVENIQEMAAAGVINTIEPIGTIKPHPVGVPGVVPLGSEFKLLDGSVVVDAASPMNGKRIFNFIGANVVLTVALTPDADGAYGTVSLDDIFALGVHDYVSGTGIAEHSVVTSIDYDTGEIVISDPSATGEIECTFWNEGRGIVGGGFGSVGDKGQRLTGQWGGDLEGLYINAGLAGASGSMVDIQRANTRGVNATTAQTRSGGIGFDSSGSPYARTSADVWGKTKTDAYSMGIYIKIKNVS